MGHNLHTVRLLIKPQVKNTFQVADIRGDDHPRPGLGGALHRDVPSARVQIEGAAGCKFQVFLDSRAGLSAARQAQQQT